jgi:hypothetical protein
MTVEIFYSVRRYFMVVAICFSIYISAVFEHYRGSGVITKRALISFVVYPSPVNHSFTASQGYERAKISDLANYRLGFSRGRTLKLSPFSLV